MRLFLALSCLQTRVMAEAWRDLLLLAPDGIQLTPGCIPSPGFRDLVEASKVPFLLHHGFSWQHRKQEVWNLGELAVEAGRRSVHPPVESGRVEFDRWLESAAGHADLVYETMYPGYLLGRGVEISRALKARLPLAIDISHLHIQVEQGAISATEQAELLAYENVREVHVSHNGGRCDTHDPVSATTYLLDWALERGDADVPIVLESYFHRLTDDDRRRQIDVMREGRWPDA